MDTDDIRALTVALGIATLPEADPLTCEEVANVRLAMVGLLDEVERLDEVRAMLAEDALVDVARAEVPGMVRAALAGWRRAREAAHLNDAKASQFDRMEAELQEAQSTASTLDADNTYLGERVAELEAEVARLKSTRIVRRPIGTRPAGGEVLLFYPGLPDQGEGPEVAQAQSPTELWGSWTHWSPLPPLAEEDAPTVPTVPTLTPETAAYLRATREAASIPSDDPDWSWAIDRQGDAERTWVAAGCPDLPPLAEEQDTPTEPDLSALLVPGWDSGWVPERAECMVASQDAEEPGGWWLRWRDVDGDDLAAQIPWPFLPGVAVTADMLRALGFTVEGE